MCVYVHACIHVGESIYIEIYNFFLNSSLQKGTGRPVASNKAITCAELVLDVSPKTQRVILKKKVRELGVYNERFLALGGTQAL